MDACVRAGLFLFLLTNPGKIIKGLRKKTIQKPLKTVVLIARLFCAVVDFPFKLIQSF
jgi:hypothetical protein